MLAGVANKVETARWKFLDGLQRLFWLAFARAQAEPEMVEEPGSLQFSISQYMIYDTIHILYFTSPHTSPHLTSPHLTSLCVDIYIYIYTYLIYLYLYTPIYIYRERERSYVYYEEPGFGAFLNDGWANGQSWRTKTGE